MVTSRSTLRKIAGSQNTETDKIRPDFFRARQARRRRSSRRDLRGRVMFKRIAAAVAAAVLFGVAFANLGEASETELPDGVLRCGRRGDVRSLRLGRFLPAPPGGMLARQARAGRRPADQADLGQPQPASTSVANRRDRADHQSRALGHDGRSLGLPDRRQGRLQGLRALQAQAAHRGRAFRARRC